VPPRARRSLVPVEVACVILVAIAPLPYALPLGAPLLAVGALSLWLRGRSFGDRFATPSRDVLFASLAAGIVAVALAGPLQRAFGVTALEWWLVPATATGGPQLALVVAILVVDAIAIELALRGWIVERMLELSPGPPTLPIMTAALVEALVIDGPIAARIGAFGFSAGLGMLYASAGRNLVAPVAARCIFALGSVAWSLAA
jgi:hypothetical protein